jgi:SOS-response transcriptional repressor LexA
MSSLSILPRAEFLRERLLTDAAKGLRITGFQSPAEDEKEQGLSLDLLTDIWAPYMWPVRVLDTSLVGFAIFQGDKLVVNRAATQVDDRLAVVDLGSDGYQVRLVMRDMFGGRWLRAAESHIPDVQLDGDVPIEIFGVVRYVLSRTAE